MLKIKVGGAWAVKSPHDVVTGVAQGLCQIADVGTGMDLVGVWSLLDPDKKIKRETNE